MKKYLNSFNIIYLLLITAVLVGDVFYILGSELWVKSVTSLGFLLIGVLSLVFALKYKRVNLKFAITMVVGLVFAMIGDILLDVDFIIGAIFFAVGHIGYFIAYCFLCKFKWLDLVIGGTIALASTLVILLLPIFTFSPTMQILIIFYAIIISFMLGKALSNLIRQRNLINLIIFIGSLLFFFSDLMILLRSFTDIPSEMLLRILCLGTYYPAEILLALSARFLPKKQN